jgi:hypothetical protein
LRRVAGIGIAKIQLVEIVFFPQVINFLALGIDDISPDKAAFGGF